GSAGLLDVATVIGVYGFEPAVARMRVAGLPGVVLPGRLKLRKRAISTCLPWNVGEQLCERAQAFFAPAQFFVLRLAFDEVRGESRQDVEQPQIAFGGLVYFTPMSGNHADELPATRKQRRGLNGANAGLAIGREICRADQISG